MFVILGTSRTGSSSLLYAMRAHPDVSFTIGEPFNRDQHDCWKVGAMRWIPARAQNVEQIRFALEQIHKERGRGVPDGYKMMRYNILPHAFAKWVKEEGGKVVFIERRNALKATVSDMLAHKTGAWNKSKCPPDYMVQKWDELSIHSIENNVRWRHQLDQDYKDALADHGFFHVYYEDFYFGERWKVILPQIQEYLGYRKFLDGKMKRWLVPSQRINDERIYLNIGNVYEIERRIGNDENGRLFESGPPLFL